MSEVGAVVAELDLEDGSDFSDDDEDYDDYDASSTEDEEDEFGRSTRKVVDDEMRRRMIELEEKLGLRMMQNVGPNPDTVVADKTSVFGDARTKKTRKEPEIVKEKKGVRFAEKLDIAEASPTTATAEPKTKAPSKSPIRDIVERSPSTEEPEAAPIATQKISRFKSARASKVTSAGYRQDYSTHKQAPCQPSQQVNPSQTRSSSAKSQPALPPSQMNSTRHSCTKK